MCNPITKQSNQKGAALVTAIFAILLATLIGAALHYMATISLTVAVNERDNTEAFYIAEAGAEHAKALISKVEKSKYSLILKAGANFLPNTGDELSVPPVSGLWSSSESIPSGNKTCGGVTSFGAGSGGRYWVSVRNDTATGETSLADLNGILIITSTGVGRNGANSTIEMAVKAPGEIPAFLINSKVKITGNLVVKGSQGAVHANGTLDFDGIACADQYFSSTAGIIDSNNSRGAGCNNTGVNRTYQPVIDPPIYNIRSDFYNKADFVLGAISSQAGKVYNKSGQMIHNTSTQGNDWISAGSKWTWSASQKSWTHDGNTINNGTYYSEGNLIVKDNFGSNTTPKLVTSIAEGYVHMKGNAFISPHYQNFSMVAGTDLLIETNSPSGQINFQGIHYAYDQINFQGNPAINGVVISANQTDINSPGCNCNLVPLLPDGSLQLNGNAIITYNGGLFGNNSIKVISWREVRY